MDEYHPLFRKKEYSSDYVGISVWKRAMNLIDYHMYKSDIATIKEYMENYYDVETTDKEVEKLREYIITRQKENEAK